MSEVKLTQLDAKDIPRYTYNEENRAQRVYIVNESMANSPEARSSFSQAMENIQAPVQEKIETRVEKIEVPVIITETRIEKIEVPVYITEYKEIEKIVIVPEVNIIRIPEYITKTEYKEIQVPVVVEKKEIVYIDKFNYKMFIMLQAITLAIIIASKLIK